MGVQTIFHNLDRSDALESLVFERLTKVLDKNQMPEDVTANVTLSLDHEQVSGDIYSARIIMTGKNMRPVVINQLGENAYQAFYLAHDRLAEVLHRHMNKRRDVVRQDRRKFKSYARSALNWRDAS